MLTSSFDCNWLGWQWRLLWPQNPHQFRLREVQCQHWIGCRLWKFHVQIQMGIGFRTKRNYDMCASGRLRSAWCSRVLLHHVVCRSFKKLSSAHIMIPISLYLSTSCSQTDSLFCHMKHDHIPKKLNSWPFDPNQGLRVCVRTEYLLLWCSALHSLQFDMQHDYFKKNVFWLRVCLCYHVAACVIPFNLICNMTILYKKYNFGLSSTP